MVLEAVETHQLDRLTRQLLAFGLVDPVQLGQKFHVPANGPPRHERRVLEHVADSAAIDVDSSRRRVQQAGRDLEQGRLSAARRADDRHEFALRHVERHVRQRFGSIREPHRNVGEGQCRHVVGPPRTPVGNIRRGRLAEHNRPTSAGSEPPLRPTDRLVAPIPEPAPAIFPFRKTSVRMTDLVQPMVRQRLFSIHPAPAGS